MASEKILTSHTYTCLWLSSSFFYHYSIETLFIKITSSGNCFYVWKRGLPTRFFYNQRNFFIYWASHVAQVLLNTYRHRHDETLLYLLYLYPYLDLGLFMSYLCRPFFIFIFIMINRKSLEYIHTCCFAYFYFYFWMITSVRMWIIFK